MLVVQFYWSEKCLFVCAMLTMLLVHMVAFMVIRLSTLRLYDTLRMVSSILHSRCLLDKTAAPKNFKFCENLFRFRIDRGNLYFYPMFNQFIRLNRNVRCIKSV